MRYLASIFVFLTFATQFFAQEETKISVDSKVESAIIYLNGAELEQNAKVNLSKGNNLVVFKGISPSLNAKSIRMSSDTEVSVLSITTKNNYLIKKNELPLIKKLKDSIEIIEDAIKFNGDELNALTSEKEMVLANKQLGGTASGVTVADLKLGADFFRQRVLEINKNISKIEKKNKSLELLLQVYTNELDETNTRSTYTESEIHLLVSSPVAGPSNIKLLYMVANAGWVPSYEIKADDLVKPIELVYKAKVFNNTSIPWENISIKLSIADPSVSITKPDLKPWYLDFYSSARYDLQKGNQGYIQNVISDNLISDIKTTGENESYEELDIPDMSAEFEIKSTYSIPADDKPYVIDIETHSLPAGFKHYAVTKLDKAVFLLANVTGWQDLNLVDGYANVYFKGTYLGESLIKTRNVKDTLDLSLGRDDKVLVTRSKLKDYSSKQLMGGKLKETLSFDLIAKNNRKNAIDIEILDQIPISKNSEIEVKEIELSGAEFNPVTGEVKWKHNLKAGETKRMVLTFYIRYPKNQSIEVQQMKRMEVRKF